MANAVMADPNVIVAVSADSKKPTEVEPRPLGGVVVKNEFVMSGLPSDAAYVTPLTVKLFDGACHCAGAEQKECCENRRAYPHASHGHSLKFAVKAQSHFSRLKHLQSRFRLHRRCFQRT